MGYNQRDIINHRVSTLAIIKAISNAHDETRCFCNETWKLYQYITAGSAYTANDDTILITGAGGNTRWVSTDILLAPIDGPSFTGDVIAGMSGKLLIGDTVSRTIGGVNSYVQIVGDSIDTARMSFQSFTANKNGPVIQFGKSRSATKGGFTILQPDDRLGEFRFYGTDGTDMVSHGASIMAKIYGAPGANSLPTRLVFETCASGAQAALEKATILPNGFFGILESDPDSELEVNGTIHATNLDGGAVNLTVNASGQIIRDPSDGRLKNIAGEIENPLGKVLSLKGRKYTWKQEAGMGDGIDYGFIAQEVEAVDPSIISKSTVNKETFKLRKVQKKIGTKTNSDGIDEDVFEEVEEKVYAKPTIDNQMGVKQGAMIVLLVEAVKEQNLAIEALKNELLSIKLLVGK